jgi:cell division septation protein DedD
MDGEKELVLGNKQLVSFFFVVLALCGVFFALGYMIGRNSTKMTVADGSPASMASAASTTGQRSQESEPPRETVEESPRKDTPSEPPVVTETAPQTQPAHDTPEPAAKPAVAEKPVATPASAAQLAVPEPGAMYLQVGALHHADAETMVKTLREQGYPAVLATSSKPDFFRVLVGPYHSTAQVADSKAKLKTLGFADAFVLR